MPQPHQLSCIVIRPGSDFDFRRTVLGHGWYALPPFSFDAESNVLSGALSINRRSAAWQLSEDGRHLRLRIPGGFDATSRKTITRVIRSCLRLDEDFSEFHAAMRRRASHRWIARSGSGRLLRAPTVFEDATKMLLTTNCSWSLTEAMVGRLMREFGRGGSFPRPEVIARSSEHVLRTRCGLGYRAPYVLELARSVADGSLEIESWRRSQASTEELYATIGSVKGFGPYAAGNLLKLLGRYDYLGLDSWVRAQYARLYGGGRRASDRAIERRYREYGQWRGLVFWLEMTRHWHDEKFKRRSGGN